MRPGIIKDDPGFLEWDPGYSKINMDFLNPHLKYYFRDDSINFYNQSEIYVQCVWNFEYFAIYISEFIKRYPFKFIWNTW